MNKDAQGSLNGNWKTIKWFEELSSEETYGLLFWVRILFEQLSDCHPALVIWMRKGRYDFACFGYVLYRSC